jgi:hypothetical protein
MVDVISCFLIFTKFMDDIIWLERKHTITYGVSGLLIGAIKNFKIYLLEYV